MNPANPRAKRLHVRLFTLMLGLIIAFFLALSLVTWYMGTERDMRDTNDKITRVGRELKGVLDAELDPMKTAIRMLAETSLVSGRTHRERLAQFGSMAAALGQNPTAGSVYAGTGNGSFVMMRNLKDRPKDRATFGAPDEAMFLVQSVNRDTGAAVGRFDFYDAKLAPVKSVSKPDYQFDPRVRPWYEQAKRESPPDGIVQTAPYIFASNQKVGITLATFASDRSGAVGIDMSLTGLSRLIGSQKVSPSAELVLFDGAGRVLAYRDSDRIFKKDADGKTVVVAVPELKVAALAALFAQWKAGAVEAADVAVKLDVGGKEWYSRIQRIDGTGGTALFLGIAAPTAELMADSIRIRNTTAALSLVLLLLMLPVVVYTSKRISRPLIDLVKVAKAIESFDFAVADPAPSHIREVDDLAHNMTKMKQTLKRFLDISSALSAESNFHRLINIILREMILVSGSTSGSLALVSPDKAGIRTVARQINGVEQDVENAASVPLADAGSAPVEVKAVLEGSRQSLHVDHSDAGHRALYGSLLDALEVPRAYVVALPLRNRSNEVLGVLTLTLPEHEGEAGVPISPALLAFIEALSGTAAIAIDNQKMLLDQKALLEGMIQLVAGAIDAKSPYSGGHCQRVPELSKMLARAACEKADGPFAGFDLTEDGWEALHIAGWLHDCGKVTTPEYVVDKATKLETIYDRIHEIRMRFEVLKRDVEIAALQGAVAGLPAGTVDSDRLRADVAARQATLDDEFAFVATCNVGGEFMAPEKIDRLKELAGRCWLRTLDDRMGVSEQELLSKQGIPAQPLPVLEQLLADKPEHITPRAERDSIAPDNPWGFRITPPANLYNRGEIYNLSIARGTLTAEDRYKINEHIVQTIKMLSSLPFPKHLSRVTEIAGGHHEKLDGGGYPCSLTKENMSVEARIMAIADVFEALTAVDRPYKKGKTLSEAVKIMSFMKKDRHIDPDLFAIFLESGVYLEYARRFMRPEQIDEVDVTSYLG
ncbi:MAG: metal-dependent phosphohydrolase [Rhodocyclales bacterium]|nr:metal-dependent phosphohydrolase [Rhodocyclales bacterium]